MVEISLANGASVISLVLVLLVAAGLVGVFYYRKFGELKRGRWQLLLILRLLAIAIVVLLLFRPVVHFYREEQQKPTVVFLLDTSASMKIADDVSGIPRFTQARDKILVWADRLKDHFAVQVIPFAERAGDTVSRGHSEPQPTGHIGAGWTRNLAFEGTRSCHESGPTIGNGGYFPAFRRNP